MTDVDRMVVWLRETLDAAQRDAEAAAPVRRPVPGGEVWSVEEAMLDTPDGVPSGVWVVTGPQGENGVAVVQGDPRARHVARHDPAAVLRRIAADRELLDDALAESHFRNEEDNWYSCAALVDEAGEPVCLNDTRAPGPCDCGRDARVQRRVRLLAEGWGWIEVPS